jgi:hypothetical protein
MTESEDTTKRQAWLAAKVQHPVGSTLTGIVVRQTAFGVFLDLGLRHACALLEVINFADVPDFVPGGPPPARPSIYDVRFPALGETVTGTVTGYSENNGQIRITAKLSRHQG